MWIFRGFVTHGKHRPTQEAISGLTPRFFLYLLPARGTTSCVRIHFGGLINDMMASCGISTTTVPTWSKRSEVSTQGSGTWEGKACWFCWDGNESCGLRFKVRVLVRLQGMEGVHSWKTCLNLQNLQALKIRSTDLCYLVMVVYSSLGLFFSDIYI